MLFLPFLFLAKALAVSLMKTVACMQKVFLLYIKILHSFFPPLQNAHFRIVCLLLNFLSSPRAAPPLFGFIFPLSSQCLTLTPDRFLFPFPPPLLGVSSAFLSPSQASHCPVNPGHKLVFLFAQKSNFLPTLLNPAGPFAKEGWDVPACPGVKLVESECWNLI